MLHTLGASPPTRLGVKFPKGPIEKLIKQSSDS